MVLRICIICKKEFETKHNKQKCCNHKCSVKKWRENNKDKIREYKKKYRENNKDKTKESEKKYKENNKDKIREYNKKYRENNKDKRNKQHKKWRENNKQKIKVWENKNREKRTKQTSIRNKKHRKENVLFAISNNMRSRINGFLNKKRIIKRNKTFEIVGCTPETLKAHLEQQFTLGMSWRNYGWGWHIDHIIPLASANNETELYKLCHYTNLQPMWALDNIKKGAKIE
jgi:hypothetical protein